MCRWVLAPRHVDATFIFRAAEALYCAQKKLCVKGAHAQAPYLIGWPLRLTIWSRRLKTKIRLIKMQNSR
jgi:hypothetical protein